MRKSILTWVLVCVCATIAAAQNKIHTEWKCDKASKMNAIEVPDKANHTYTLAQLKCTAVKGEIAGVKDKEGVATEFGDATGASSKGHGVFVETMANGDKLHFNYTTDVTYKGHDFASGNNKWEISDGTGKFKGMKASGSCAGKGNADGSSSWTCTGTYSVR